MVSVVDHWWCNVWVLTSSVVDHWWCNGSCAHLECGRSLVV